MRVPCFSFPRNPNYPHEFSRKGPEFAVPWPDFVPGANGESYKEFSAQLPNRPGLKKADCSFWSKYIRSLKAPAGREPGAGGPGGGQAGVDTQHLLCAHCALGLSEPLGANGHWEAISTSLSHESSGAGGLRGAGVHLCQGPPVPWGQEREVRERTLEGGAVGQLNGERR